MAVDLRFVLTGAKRVFDSRAMYAQVVVTEDCNLNCAYCDEYTPGAPIIALEELKRRIDRLEAREPYAVPEHERVSRAGFRERKEYVSGKADRSFAVHSEESERREDDSELPLRRAHQNISHKAPHDAMYTSGGPLFSACSSERPDFSGSSFTSCIIGEARHR